MMWFLFECRNGHELKAKKELTALSMQVLLPMGKKYMRPRPKRNEPSAAKTYPLWGGYICGGARLVPWTELRKRFSNPHCALAGPLVLDSGEAHPIGPALIEEIKNRSWLELAPFDLGDRISVTEGPFTGRVGSLVDLDDSRAEIILDILGKSVRATFDPAHLEKVA